MTSITLIGIKELDELVAKLAGMGCCPEGKYPADMVPGGQWPEADALARKIYVLRQKISENKALIEWARNQSTNNYERLVLEAFEREEKLYPPTFEYGLAAGNYCTNLVSDGNILYRTQRIPGREYGQRLVAIAAWPEEVAP